MLTGITFRGIFDLRLPPTSEVLLGRRNALQQIQQWVLGRNVTWREFIRFVNMQPRSIRVNETAFTGQVHEAMVAFTEFVGEEVRASFQVTPVNAVGALLNWKVLMILIAALGKEEQDYLREMFPAPMGEEVEARPRGFDAYFHWDRLCKKLPSSKGNWDRLGELVPVAAGQMIEVVGACASFCDEVTWPTNRELEELPQEMVVAVGIHPKNLSEEFSGKNCGRRGWRCS
ncbi:MAG: hypothetical protein OEZ04_10030 [Nitrospinota bacterium]|nr:hypothetical protein [Nitrospinota bacterium]